MDWLNNPWVIGIGGGIISGLLVMFITRWLFSNQDQRLYNRKVAEANREVVLAVRDSIPEDKLPSPDVLSALIAATARKHSVEINDLYGKVEIAQELIKEIMDSNFIGADTKDKYCTQLSNLAKPQEGKEVTHTRYIQEDRQRFFIQATSKMLGISAAAMSMFVALFIANDRVSPVGSIREPLTVVLLPASAVMIGVATMMLLARIRHLKSEEHSIEKSISTQQRSKKSTAKYLAAEIDIQKPEETKPS